MKKLEKFFCCLSILSAIFCGVSACLLDNTVYTLIGTGTFVFSAIATLCLDRKYTNIILELLDILWFIK